MNHPHFRPNEWTVIHRTPDLPSGSWWIGLTQEKFYEIAKLQAVRQAQHSGDLVVRSIRPVTLGGKLP